MKEEKDKKDGGVSFGGSEHYDRYSFLADPYSHWDADAAEGSDNFMTGIYRSQIPLIPQKANEQPHCPK